jgi:hypothetical protein
MFGCISSAKINYINETTNGLRPGCQAILPKPLTIQAPDLSQGVLNDKSNNNFSRIPIAALVTVQASIHYLNTLSVCVTCHE